jgi:hypothetical protein
MFIMFKMANDIHVVTLTYTDMPVYARIIQHRVGELSSGGLKWRKSYPGKSWEIPIFLTVLENGQRRENGQVNSCNFILILALGVFQFAMPHCDRTGSTGQLPLNIVPIQPAESTTAAKMVLEKREICPGKVLGFVYQICLGTL